MGKLTHELKPQEVQFNGKWEKLSYYKKNTPSQLDIEHSGKLTIV